MKVDRTLNVNLGLLAEHEQRTKLDELRFLVKDRLKELKIKEASS
jgi:hypothetical protein